MENLISAKDRFFEIVHRLISYNKISHAYLIEINDYSIDMEYILSFIKMILCTNKNTTLDSINCSKCNICKLIDKGNYPDLRIIEPDGQWIKKGQLLDLQKEYQNKSLLGNKRIYIIKEADKLNSSSANTILKFLEEPEDDIVAILITTNRYKVIDTIISRCQILSLQDDIVDKNISVETLNLIEYIVKDELFIRYSDILNNILLDKTIAKERLIEVENVFINYLNYLSSRDLFPCDNQIVELLKSVDYEKLINYIMIIEDSIKKLEYNVNYKLWMDSFFARIIGG